MNAHDVAGAAVAVVAAGCFEVAYVMQALEARAVITGHELRASLIGQLARRRRWLAAMALSGAGALLQIAALALAPLAVVQPTLALGLLLLLYLGRRVLGERVGRREIAGALAILAGVAVVLLAAPPDPTHVTVHAGATIALAGLGALVVAPYAARIAGRVPGVLVVAGAGAGDAWAAVAGKLIAEQARQGRIVAALAWAAGAGLALAMGLTSEMTALGRMAATRVGPVVQLMALVIPVVLAATVLGENWAATPAGGAVLAAGVATVAAGAWLLLSSQPLARIERAVHGPAPGEAVEDDLGGRRQRGE